MPRFRIHYRMKLESFTNILHLGQRKRNVSKNVFIIFAFVVITQFTFTYRQAIITEYSRELIFGNRSVISHLEAGNGYEQLKNKLPSSFAVNLTGKTFDFAPPPVVYPLTIYENAYHIENKHLCDIGRDLTFLVMVHTATNHFMRRQAMRETWANKDILEQNDIRIVFLLGKPGNEANQTKIENEMSLYGDIVQGNFLDSYHNLTHKAAMSVRWVVEHCLNTKVIAKIDDDVFIPVFQFIEMARNVWSKQTKAIHCRNHVTRVRRFGKWNVEPEYFKNMERYPFRSCMGFIQVMTADMFPSLYAAAKETQFFWIDDIYLSGILVERVGGVTFYTPQNNLLLGEQPTLKCFENEPCDIFVGFARTPGFMKRIWNRYLILNKDLAAKYYFFN